MPDRLIISPYGEKDGMLSYLPGRKKIWHSHAKIPLDLIHHLCLVLEEDPLCRADLL